MKYDLIVIGAGPGGYTAAIRGAQEGLNVCLIENKWLGGTCANVGCIPTKVYAHAADVLHEFNSAREFGIQGNYEVDIPTLKAKKNQVVSQLTGGISYLLKKNRVNVISGQGILLDKNTVSIEEELLTARFIIIATGSETIVPPIPGIDSEKVMFSDEALELEVIPQKLAVVGAGVIGLELANIYHSLGSEVVLFDVIDCLLPPLDHEVSNAYKKSLEMQGMKIQLESRILDIGKDGSLTVETPSSTSQWATDRILVSVGRKPNLSGLEGAGLELTKKGIVVNEHLQTNYKNVYCIGDVNGLSQLAHSASYQADIAINNILGKPTMADLSLVPGCVFSNPDVAWVGINEKQAETIYDDIHVGTFSFMSSGRAKTMGKTDGMIKVVTQGDKHTLIGMQMIGVSSSELIEVGTIAIEQGLGYSDFEKTIFIHPTIAECIKEAMDDTRGHAIHK